MEISGIDEKAASINVISLPKTIVGDFTQALRYEWLETNGLGGWASSTVCGANSRRYHGLLVAATRPPTERKVILSRLDETVIVGGKRYELGCNRFPGAVHPQGFTFLEKFEKDLFPTFEYRVAGVTIRKTITAVYGENTTLIRYELSPLVSDLELELLPLAAFRDYHSLTHANGSAQTAVQFADGILSFRMYPDYPELFIAAPGAQFSSGPDWYYNFEYDREKERGLDYREDLFTPGTMRLNLSGRKSLTLIISTQNPSGRAPEELFQSERQRRSKLITAIPQKNFLRRTLTLAADQFIVRRGADLRTIIAGYHWFTDWGRDTMLALPGLTLATGRIKDARKILKAFAEFVDEGMLPNRFPEAGERPEYNTIDATLWFFVAIYHYWKTTGDNSFIINVMLPVLSEIVEWHYRGTRYNIHVDDDGLLAGGAPGVQLTWMDAKIGDWVVTPRQGKAVEINALWYNALKIYACFLKEANRPTEAQRVAADARKTKLQFRKQFWMAEKGYLRDFIDGPVRNEDLRPNQIFALSLPFPLLTGKEARSVLRTVQKYLLTPVGLRSLSPDHPDYQGHYGGDPFRRDSAYHQGTVWSWLLGPFLTALVRVRGETGRREARRILQEFEAHLCQAGVGTVSEIFDGDPPHTPRGCIAQAWSVGELLRVVSEDINTPKTGDTEPEQRNCKS